MTAANRPIIAAEVDAIHADFVARMNRYYETELKVREIAGTSAVFTQLRAAGVENIWKAGACTYCVAGSYYSFRREKEQAGRMLSWIGTGSQTRRADTAG